MENWPKILVSILRSVRLRIRIKKMLEKCDLAHILNWCHFYIRINQESLESYAQHQSYFSSLPLYIAYAKHRKLLSCDNDFIFFYFYLVHKKKKKRNLESLDGLNLEFFFLFQYWILKSCLKVNMKIYLLRILFHAQPCTSVIKIQMYFFYWLYSTINLFVLNKYKIEKIQILQAQYWNTTAVLQSDFSPWCSWDASWGQIFKCSGTKKSSWCQK